MLCEMADRGSDSAGVAVYGDPSWSPPGHGCVSLLDAGASTDEVAAAVGAVLSRPVTVTRLGATYQLSAAVDAEALLAAARDGVPRCAGRRIRRRPHRAQGRRPPTRTHRRRGACPAAQGWQGVGHTRMATESAVTPSGAHPYAVGPDQCLVHNGSFANHATIRRELIADGVRFDSENDTEVGARFVAQQLAAGRDVETALKELCATFDGFYTLLVSNRDSFAVVRDAIACKPAVIAETDDWVAMASEYRALAGLPGVENAAIWEPEPEVVYAWRR